MLSAVYLDMDGVIVDLMRHTFRAVGIPEDRLDEAFNLTTKWDAVHTAITEVTGTEFTASDLFKLWADGGQEFWASAPWTSHGRAIYELCSRYAPVVLMTTPTLEPSCAAGKMEWIQRNIPKHAQRQYALSPCKHHMAHAGALLIDDGEHNITKFLLHEGEAFLWPGPWNENCDLSFDQALKQLAATLVRLSDAR